MPVHGAPLQRGYESVEMAYHPLNVDAPLRVGAVSYLNTAPLIDALPDLHPAISLELDHPSRLADRMAAGQLDVALVPTVELARHPDWTLVSDACIAARGPVLSVKLLFRKSPAAVETIAADEGSRTSVVLSQVLLADMHGACPRVSSLPLDAAPADTDADAVLVIGDRAMRTADDAFVEIWDLGDRWCRWTELPFVFAVWAARPGVDASGIRSALEEARARGCRNIERIARERAAAMRLSRELVTTYLRDHLHFQLGPGERRGLSLFYRRAHALGLIPHVPPLKLDDCTACH